MPDRKPYYGIDAPGVVRNFVLLSASGLVVGTLLHSTRFRGFSSALFTMSLWFGFTALVMIWSSLYGKFRTRDHLLDVIPWRGDEEVLDVGCGRGLMLHGAAHRIPRGRAFGIDLWQTEDQSGNSREATMANSAAEGVAERVEIVDGDARELPFASGRFDVVLSSLAIHNIYDEPGRQKALDEIIRVVKPGGYIGIIDIRHGGAYAGYLEAQGMKILRNRWSLLFMLRTHSIVAQKV